MFKDKTDSIDILTLPPPAQAPFAVNFVYLNSFLVYAIF